MRDGFGGPPLLDRKRIENQRGYYHETADLLFYLDREDAWSIVEEFAPDAPDAFDRLGLGQDATPEEVKTAYRRHSKEVHPDQGGDKKEFLELHESYEIALEFVS
jgi:DnaJ-class molecular chaperone